MGVGRGGALLFKSSHSLFHSILLPNFSTFAPPAALHTGLPSLRQISKRTVRMSSSDLPDGPPPSSSAAADGTSSSSAASIDFLTLCHRLKTTKRAGWVRRGVSDPESIADHMYRMGVMALVAPDVPGADRDRLVKMAIVHDIAEAIVGDITPADGVPKLEKSRREREAIDHMCNLLGGGSRAKEIEELWMEYEENSSLEAKVVKDFDKLMMNEYSFLRSGLFRLVLQSSPSKIQKNLQQPALILVEMILQALEYEKEQDMDLDEFFQSTAGKFQTDVGKAWALEIASRRRKEQ